MKVVAHRGFCGKYPENTMLAFQKAVENQCDEIELDVQLTKDGEIVIIHDESIDRVTEATGFVRDYTYEQLRKFNACHLYGDQFGVLAIPTFEEYCQWVRTENVTTNIELKTGVYYYSELEERTIAMLRKYDLEDRVMFSSFNHLSLLSAKKMAPHIPCGALLSARGG